MLFIGAVLIIIGIAITAGTHEAAVDRGGGYYVIAGGPIVVGLRCIFRGLKS